MVWLFILGIIMATMGMGICIYVLVYQKHYWLLLVALILEILSFMCAPLAFYAGG